MLVLNGTSYENVEYQSPLYEFHQLCEKTYLSSVISELSRHIGSEFYKYNFIIYSGSSSAAVDLGSGDPSKTIVIYISDESSSVPYALCASVRAVFKSYLPGERIVNNLHSFPLGYVDSTPDLGSIPIDKRHHSVFFSGNLNGNRIHLFKTVATPNWSPVLFPVRMLSLLNPSKICDRFVPDAYIRFTNRFRGGLTGEDYARKLVDSKIAICPRGFRSAETFRHFEAMRAGAIVLSEELPALDCYVGSPIITMKRWRGLRSIILKILTHPETSLEMQHKSLAWYNDMCSEKAVAARIADRIL